MSEKTTRLYDTDLGSAVHILARRIRSQSYAVRGVAADSDANELSSAALRGVADELETLADVVAALESGLCTECALTSFVAEVRVGS